MYMREKKKRGNDMNDECHPPKEGDDNMSDMNDMSDLITDEMVGKAAKAMAEDWNPERDPVVTFWLRRYALSALKAVAPLIAAKAWEEGYQACRNRPRVDGYLINRANPYQTRTDAIERSD